MGECIVCILGAVVGAGFASGREMQAFFGQYGALAPLLIIVAALLISIFAYHLMRNKNGAGAYLLEGKGVCGMVTLGLMLITGGAMLAATGEAAALIVPIHFAREMGMAVTLTLAFIISNCKLKVMAIPGLLLIVLLVFMLVLVQGDERRMDNVSLTDGIIGGYKALSYAGMNVMLALGIFVKAGRGMDKRSTLRVCLTLFACLGALFTLAINALFSSDVAVRQSVLPFVEMLRPFGKMGYYLSATLLYFASLSTLVACLNVLLHHRAIMSMKCGKASLSAALFLIAYSGLEKLVENVYPFIGFVCLCLLIFVLFVHKKQVDNRAALL